MEEKPSVRTRGKGFSNDVDSSLYSGKSFFMNLFFLDMAFKDRWRFRDLAVLGCDLSWPVSVVFSFFVFSQVESWWFREDLVYFTVQGQPECDIRSAKNFGSKWSVVDFTKLFGVKLSVGDERSFTFTFAFLVHKDSKHFMMLTKRESS